MATIVKVRLEGDSEHDVLLAASQLGVRVSCVKTRDDCYQLYGTYSIQPLPPSSLKIKCLEAIESAYQQGHQTLTNLGVGLEGMDIASRIRSKVFDFSDDSTDDILADLRSREAAGRDDDETKALRTEIVRRELLTTRN